VSIVDFPQSVVTPGKYRGYNTMTPHGIKVQAKMLQQGQQSYSVHPNAAKSCCTVYSVCSPIVEHHFVAVWHHVYDCLGQLVQRLFNSVHMSIICAQSVFHWVAYSPVMYVGCLCQSAEIRQLDESVGFGQVFTVVVAHCAENSHEGLCV